MGGGSELALYYLSTSLCEMGVDVHVLLDEGQRKDYELDRVKVHSYPIPNNPVGAYWATLSVLSKTWKRFKFETLIDFEQAVVWQKATTASAVLKFVNEKRLKLVYYFGNHYPWLLPPSENPWFLWWFLKRVVKRSDVVLAASSLLAKKLSEKTGFKKVFVVPFGVRLNDYQPSEQTRNGVLYVGRVVKHKGLDDLLLAFKLLKDQGFLLRLKIIGPRGDLWDDTPSSYYMSLKRKMEKFGLLDRIEFTGSLPKLQVIQEMKSASVFAFPSHEEGFGLALVQAMASGLVPVVYDLEPMNEVVAEAGVKARPFDAENFAECIIKADNESLRAISFERAKRFSIELVAKEFLARV